MNRVVQLLVKGKEAVADALGDFFYLVAFTIKSHGARDSKDLTPEEVMNQFLSDNLVVSNIRRWLIKWRIMRDPQGVPHANKLAIACGDSRIVLHAIVGSLKLNIDCLRVPGSAIAVPELIQSIGLFLIEHRVKFAVILRHTDCALEKIQADPSHSGHEHYNCLITALVENGRFVELLKEHAPAAYRRFARGEVKIGHGILDTSDNRILEWEEYAPLAEDIALADAQDEIEVRQLVNA